MEPKRKSVLVRWGSFPFVFFATIFVLFEEWLWFRLLRFMKFVWALPVFKQIENWMRRQNKWVSLVMFMIPELLFIPMKLSVVWLFGNHHPYLGVMIFLTAKVVGTASFAWLYSVTEAKITEFGWICWIRDRFIAVRSWAHKWLQAQSIYQWVHSEIVRLRTVREHWLKRRSRAAVIVARRQKQNLDK